MVFSGASSPAPAQPVTPLAAKQLLKEVRKIERKVRRLRGLKAQHYRKAIVSGAELQKLILQGLAREHPDAELSTEQAVWKRLGLLPPGADYKKLLMAAGRASEAVAHYDHRARKLYVHDGARLPAHGPVLAKEICHALQDRRFRVKRMVAPIKDDRDRQLARRSLVEGDCARVMVAYMLAPKKDLGDVSGDLGRELRKTAAGKPDAAPLLVRETQLFPIVEGLRFIQRVRARHPWRVVNSIYRRPPRSTEQVLHPRKYWRRERPAHLRTAKLPALADLQEVHRGVLGELILSLYLRQGVPAAGARRAAAGWGGDRLLAYGQDPAGKTLGLVHLTTWDSEADALEFANAQRHVMLARKFKLVAGAAKDLWVYTEGGGSSQWSVQLIKRHVLTLGGFSPEIRQKLQQEVWEKWRIRGQRVRPK